MSCTHTTGAASAVPLAFMPFDMLQTTCILTTCGCSGMLAMYRRRDDQRESLDWQSRGQAFGARALNPTECGPLPANVSFLSVLDDKTSQMLLILWRQVALVKGHFSERIASCVKKRLSSPLLKCIPQTGYACGSEFCVKFVKRLIPDPSFSRQQRCGVYHASCGVLSTFSTFFF